MNVKGSLTAVRAAVTAGGHAQRDASSGSGAASGAGAGEERVEERGGGNSEFSSRMSFLSMMSKRSLNSAQSLATSAARGAGRIARGEDRT